MLFVFFGGFIVLILGLVAIDLGLIGRRSHVIGVREALIRTVAWVSIALLFNLLVYFLYGHNWLDWNEFYWRQRDAATALTGAAAAEQYFLGYLLEQSLSVDNMFVIATIFAYFRVPLGQQHRVLFWGIMGALILRGVMIGLGAVLIARFSWMVYVFGVGLILTAIKMFFSGEGSVHPERNLAVRLARRLYPVSTSCETEHFFVAERTPEGKVRQAITPLFLALLLIETSDVMFAIDSIPAIFAVTSDPFIVFTSNVFAICGLRSLYFALAGLMDKFRYLKFSLVFVLGYVGVKMLLTHTDYAISNKASLAVIAAMLFMGIAASLLADRRALRAAPSPPPPLPLETSPKPGRTGTVGGERGGKS